MTGQERKWPIQADSWQGLDGQPALNCVSQTYSLILQLSLWAVEVSMNEDSGDGYARMRSV